MNNFRFSVYLEADSDKVRLVEELIKMFNREILIAVDVIFDDAGARFC